MIESLATGLDRFIIRLASARMAPPGRHPARAEEAVALLGQSDYFCDWIAPPGRLEWDRSSGRFQFPSPLPSPYPENNTVHGWGRLVEPEWTQHPTVVLVHGWNEELGYLHRYPWLAGLLARAGLNTFALELPLHLQRRPRQPGPGADFISEDLCSMVSATRQAVADIRCLVGWLRAAGTPSITLWGNSLGGWLSGLVGCHDRGIDRMVLTAPAARMDRMVAQLAFCAPVRYAMEGRNFSIETLNLRAWKPCMDPARILLVEGEYDQFVAPETVEELARAWGGTSLWRVPHGHISMILAPGLSRRIIRWIQDPDPLT